MNKADMIPAQFTAEASIGIDNTGGLEIMMDKRGDGLYYRFSHGQDLSKAVIYEAEIEYEAPSDEEEAEWYGHKPYFQHGDVRYYLSEAILLKSFTI